jgi:hypothetical protein
VIIIISTRGQFHQHFYVRIFCTNVVSAASSSYILALTPKFQTKNASISVDEIDGGWKFTKLLIQICKIFCNIGL